MKACVGMFGAGEEGLVRGYERPIMRCESCLVCLQTAVCIARHANLSYGSGFQVQGF